MSLWEVDSTNFYNHFCWAVSCPRRLAAVSDVNPEKEIRQGLIVQTSNGSEM